MPLLPLLLVGFLQAAAPAAAAPAAGIGDVNLTPKRLILSGRTRSGEVVVFNRGTRVAVYRIELKPLAMTPEGALIDPAKVSDAERARLKSADDMIRFSPRRAELQPGQSQVIRVLARSPEGEAAPEYRSHLVVSAVPPKDAGLEIERAAGEKKDGLSIRIIPVFGISIPLIVRPIDGAATAAWEAPELTRGPTALHLHALLHRAGGRSLYGNVEVRFTPRGGAKPMTVGEVRGVAVYPEIDVRTVDFDLPGEANKGADGAWSLLFRDAEATDGKVLAEAPLRAPG